MSKDKNLNSKQTVENVENLDEYKIRVYTYSNGYYDIRFFSNSYDEAIKIADELFFCTDISLFWSFI